MSERIVQAALEELETKIAYLERTTTELSDQVFRQHRELQALQAQVNTLRERQSALQPDDLPLSPHQERPPHY